jgi:hypothetical protein
MKNSVVRLAVIVLLIAFGVLGMVVVADNIIQKAEAQEMKGDIIAASLGKPFGGQKMGTVTIDSNGHRTNVTADLTASPKDGNVFEGWLVDAGGSEYKKFRTV